MSPHDGCPICICRQGLYHEAHCPPIFYTVHATRQCCRDSLQHCISRVLQLPLPCPEEVRRMETSHRPLVFELLPGHSNSGSVSQNQSTDSPIPAQPRRMCSYVADPALSLCGHRETGSSRTAAHPRSPTLHLSTLGFQCFNQKLWIPLSSMAQEELQWWMSAHNVLTGAPVTPTEPDTQLFTDASNIGWVAQCIDNN